jgi:hypothetical protein
MWITLEELAQKIVPPKMKTILAPSNWNEQVQRMYWVDNFGTFFFYDNGIIKDCKIRKDDRRVWVV